MRESKPAAWQPGTPGPCTSRATRSLGTCVGSCTSIDGRVSPRPGMNSSGTLRKGRTRASRESCPARHGPRAFRRISKRPRRALADEAVIAAGDPRRLKAWWVYRMIASPDPLGERLTLMWHDHFATSNEKVGDLAAMRRQNETLLATGACPVRRAVKCHGTRSGSARLARRRGQSPGPPQREPGPRASGAVHAGRRPLYRGRRQGIGPCPDRMDGQLGTFPGDCRSPGSRDEDDPGTNGPLDRRGPAQDRP